MRVVMTSFGDRQIDRRLLRIEERVTDPRPIYRFMASTFYRWEQDLFDTEGASGGSRWAPLRPSTIARKTRKGQPLDILHATGDLERSLTGPTARGSRMRVSRLGMEIGTTLHYGQIHYDGSPKTHLPRRRPVQLTVPHRQEWVRMMQKWIMT